MALELTFRFLLLFQLIEFIYGLSMSNVFVKLAENESIVGRVWTVYTATPATLCTARYIKQMIILDAIALDNAKYTMLRDHICVIFK